MISLVLISLPIFLFWAGKGSKSTRLVIVASLALSSIFALSTMYLGVADKLSASYYYYEFMIPLALCFVAASTRDKYTRIACISFLFISIYNLVTYTEFTFGLMSTEYVLMVGDQPLFLTLRPAVMLAISTWQIYLLIRIGDVGGNLRRLGKRYLANIKHYLANIDWAGDANTYNFSYSKPEGRNRSSFRGRR